MLLTREGDTIGRGNDRQLGHKGNPTSTGPHRVLRSIHGHRAVAVGASSDTAFFVDQVGQLWAGGFNGYCRTLFLTSDGRDFACGSSVDGQLGLADDDDALKGRRYEYVLAEPAMVTFPHDQTPSFR